MRSLFFEGNGPCFLKVIKSLFLEGNEVLVCGR